MEILHALESIRCPFLDAVMYGITQLGGEAIFMAVAIVVFWCIDKSKGYFILTVGFLSTVVNQFLKLIFRVPRPWVKDPEFTIVEAARSDAGGYSFPSGHTQNAVSTFGGIFTFTKNRLFKAGCIAVIVLVAFSRMYLGVHTFLDVAAALILGVIILFIVYPLFKSHGANHKFIYGVLIATIVIFNVLYIWNEYPYASVMLKDVSDYTLSMGASFFKGNYTVDYGGIVASSLMIIVPELIFYGLFQKNIVEGMTAGAVKG